MSDALNTRRRALAELRPYWGKPGDKSGFMANRYFELVRDREPAAWIDEKTWANLEFPAIFAHMDTAVTPVGSQVLPAQLRRYHADPVALGARHVVHDRFARRQARESNRDPRGSACRWRCRCGES